jgi:hypothetical protein
VAFSSKMGDILAPQINTHQNEEILVRFQNGNGKDSEGKHGHRHAPLAIIFHYSCASNCLRRVSTGVYISIE